LLSFFTLRPAIIFLSLLPLVYSGSSPTLGPNTLNHNESYLTHVTTQVTFFYDGRIQTITTRAQYLKEAVQEAAIPFSPFDLTNPSGEFLLSGEPVFAQVIRAQPVTIIDQDKEIQAWSAYTDQAGILNQLGIKTYPEDIIEFSSHSPRKITIKRATPVILVAWGEQKELRTQKKTIKDFLAEKNIVLGPQDKVEPSMDQELYPNIQIKVIRIKDEIVTLKRKIPYQTIYQVNKNLGFYEKRVISEGSEGEVEETYHIFYENGLPVKKIFLSSKFTKPVTNRIIERGVQYGVANFGYYSGFTTAFKGKRGAKLLVTNLDNGRQVIVTVVDYGPVNGLLDLSLEAFRALGGSTVAGRLRNVAVQLVD